MIREVVQCEECGVGGLDPVEDVCGDWIGTEDNGYKCPDKLCRACRGDDDLTEEEEWAHADT